MLLYNKKKMALHALRAFIQLKKKGGKKNHDKFMKE